MGQLEARIKGFTWVKSHTKRPDDKVKKINPNGCKK